MVIVAKETISFSLQRMGHLRHSESATERHITSGIESEGGKNRSEQNIKVRQVELLLNNTQIVVDFFFNQGKSRCVCVILSNMG